MKKFFAILALGAALMGLGGTAHAQDAASAAAASAPAAAASDAASAPMAAASSASAPASAASGPVETVNKGDVSWMLVSTALVIMMSIPGLALFYGGLVRSKNMLSVLMQVFVTFSMITVLWVIYGYSLAFTEGNE
ncbi:MAG: ammonia channel protein, partial [Burkholderiales bacterium]|nr:ammonia channel protein [Burkholderiales bacterium]